MDIPPELENIFQKSMANIDGTNDRINDHDLRVLGIYYFRNQLATNTDTWLEILNPSDDQIERMNLAWDNKLKAGEFDLKKNNFKSVFNLVGQFKLHSENKIARRQLCSILLQADIEVFRLMKLVMIAETTNLEPQNNYFSYYEFLDQLSKHPPTSGTHQNYASDTFDVDPQGAIAEPKKDPGRPAEDWEGIKDQLILMEKNGELPKIAHGWRVKVSENLLAWYGSKAISKKLQAKTIMNKKIIKDEFDRIESAAIQTP